MRLETGGKPEEVRGVRLRCVTIRNEGGVVTYEIELANGTRGGVEVDAHVRFFDEEYANEYEKIPVRYRGGVSLGESVRLRGRLDFSGLPEGRSIRKVGVTMDVRR